MSAESVARASRQFAVSPERVFDAWLDSDAIGRWMFGSAVREEEIVKIAMDPRVGGVFSFVVRRQGAEIDHIGTYREIARPRRLAFTWGIAGESTDESIVTIDVAPLETGSQLNLAHAMDPKWAEYVERTESAWTKMLATLAALLEGAPA
jgi:uncharacterized protein YndB with AHSA1/START domain